MATPTAEVVQGDSKTPRQSTHRESAVQPPSGSRAGSVAPPPSSAGDSEPRPPSDGSEPTKSLASSRAGSRRGSITTGQADGSHLPPSSRKGSVTAPRVSLREPHQLPPGSRGGSVAVGQTDASQLPPSSRAGSVSAGKTEASQLPSSSRGGSVSVGKTEASQLPPSSRAGSVSVGKAEASQLPPSSRAGSASVGKTEASQLPPSSRGGSVAVGQINASQLPPSSKGGSVAVGQTEAPQSHPGIRRGSLKGSHQGSISSRKEPHVSSIDEPSSSILKPASKPGSVRPSVKLEGVKFTDSDQEVTQLEGGGVSEMIVKELLAEVFGAPSRKIQEENEDDIPKDILNEIIDQVIKVAEEDDPKTVATNFVAELINTAMIRSDDKPENVGKSIVSELLQEVLEQVDPQTIAERVIEDVLTNISEKYDVAEDILNEILLQVVPDIETAGIKFMTLEEEIRHQLENLIMAALAQSPKAICEDILDEIVDKVISLEEKRESKLKGASFVEGKEEPEEVEEEAPECMEFHDTETVAKNVLDKILEQAQEYINAHDPHNVIRESTDTGSLMREHDSDADYNAPFVQVFEKNFEQTVVWPTINDFTVELGKISIYQYLDSWYITEDWLYCVNHLGCQSDDCSDFYYYQALWSIPTPSYPVPQATASVYFTMEVSRVIPKTCRVKVTYQFEGTRFVHKPGVIEVSEDWLFYIIDSKINLFKTVTF